MQEERNAGGNKAVVRRLVTPFLSLCLLASGCALTDGGEEGLIPARRPGPSLAIEISDPGCFT